MTEFNDNLAVFAVLGFTGTRKGMTAEQRLRVAQLLKEIRPEEFHHGDCKGADEEFHGIAEMSMPEAWSVGHPCNIDGMRAWCAVEEEREPLPPLERNDNIVAAADILIATPKAGSAEVRRSGTWYTIRKAREASLPLLIVWPDGEVTPENLR